MKPEIEAKFLNIDIDTARSTLRQAGAVCVQPMRLMRRAVIDYPDHHMGTATTGWVRIRDEGDKVTLTYKNTTEHKLNGTYEIEVVVSDYQKTIDLFLAMGMVVRSRQETRRETWTLADAEIVIDEWPWLHPFIEIEAPSEASVRAVAQTLGYDWSMAVFGSVSVVYRRQYPAIRADQHISAIPEIAFAAAPPEWFTNKVAA